VTFYGWLVFVHVLGAFLFVLFHGASAGVVLRIRRETDIGRVRTLLDLSMSMVGLFYISLLLMLVGGIWAGIEGRWFTNGQLWLWVAIGVLLLVGVAMYVFISRHFYAWRKALDGDPPTDDATLLAQIQNPQPLWGALIGLIGLVVIVWLMVFKPF
jgi:uncharacterized protein YneF (UPF0154 family)